MPGMSYLAGSYIGEPGFLEGEEPPVEPVEPTPVVPPPPSGGTIDVTVRLQALDGTWETCGVDRAVSVDPETVQCNVNEWGPDKASFDLHRSVIAIWPDLGAFTPVEVEIGGVIVWEGRIGETPLKSGAEMVINVQCEGWQYQLDDDVYQRCYVHSKLTDWKDSRSFLGADLTRYVAAPQTSAGQGVITLGWTNGTIVANANAVGVTLDLGAACAANWVGVQLDKSTVTDEAIYLYARGSNTDDAIDDYGSSDALSSLKVNGTTVGGFYSNALAFPCRYVTIFLIYNGAGGTFASDQIARLTAIMVLGDASYESANVSILKASTVIQDALERDTLLLSTDYSQITPTTFAIRDFTLTKQTTGREAIEAANAYHNYVTRFTTGRRFQFAPRPTAPQLELGAWSGSETEDTSANSGAEIYNRVIVEATGPDGSPTQVERAASAEPGIAFTTPEAQPQNPSFTVNNTGWGAFGAGSSITRDTGTFHSAPASGKWELGSEPIGAVLTAEFTGTFKEGVTYRLTFWVQAGGFAHQMGATFGVAGDMASLQATTTEAFQQLTLVWTPQAEYTTGVVLALRNIAGTVNAYIDDLELTSAEPTLVDRRGFRRTKILTTSSAITHVEGEQLADTYLKGHMTTPFKGSATVVAGGARKVIGGQPVHPSALLTCSQELIRLSDHIDPDTGAIGREATIAEVTYTHKDQKASVTLDDGRQNFQALLSRLEVVQNVGS